MLRLHGRTEKRTENMAEDTDSFDLASHFDKGSFSKDKNVIIGTLDVNSLLGILFSCYNHRLLNISLSICVSKKLSSLEYLFY